VEAILVPAVIEFQEIQKCFRDRSGREFDALADFSLQVNAGETHCLIGPSGCGKTTSLRLVNGLETPTRGKVLVDGTDIAHGDLYAKRRTIGYVIQSGGLFPHMTVAQNVGLLCNLEGWATEKTAARVDELLALANLDASRFQDQYPGELSGGEAQRVSLARALALDPPIILMDEPFGALDPITRSQVHVDFLQMLSQLKKTVLLVTHDLHEAFRLADRVTLLDQGRIVQTGTARELREEPATAFASEFMAAQQYAGAEKS
jgi:osmoprotectant transport system ATP-binding protein